VSTISILRAATIVICVAGREKMPVFWSFSFTRKLGTLSVAAALRRQCECALHLELARMDDGNGDGDGDGDVHGRYSSM